MTAPQVGAECEELRDALAILRGMPQVGATTGVDRPAVILGNPASLFCRQLAAHWRDLGLTTLVATYGWEGASVTPEGVPIVVADGGSHAGRVAARACRAVLRRVEAVLRSLQRRRYERAMRDFVHENYHPSVADAITGGEQLARMVNRLRPRFVFGQEAFSYGWATARAKAPRILFPWGGDVFLFAESSRLAAAMVGHALAHVDLVCPSATFAAARLVERFKLDPAKVVPVSWGVDLERFRPADADKRRALRARHGLPAEGVICLNLRRFNPAWGCRTVLEAFIRVAAAQTDAHFVMLGGPNVHDEVTSARQRLANTGLVERFTLYDHELPLDQCAELMRLADVGVSVMRPLDMRSSSVLQAAACGLALVLSPQPEYEVMTRQGLRAQIVPADDDVAVAEVIRGALNDPTMRSECGRQNRAFVIQHEDQTRQMAVLLGHIARVVSQREA